MGSPSSTKICGTSSSRIIGHSIKFLDRSWAYTYWSILPSLASWAIAILLDLIWLMLYFPLKSPQRLINWLTLFSRSVVIESEKYYFVIFLTISNAPSILSFSKWSLISLLMSLSPSLAFCFDSYLTNLFFMTTNWFFKGILPSFPMLRAMINPSILS